LTLEQANHAEDVKVKREVRRIVDQVKEYPAKPPKTSGEMSSSEKAKKIREKKRLGQPAGKPRRVKSLKRRK
jgi:hypothetical protein